MDSEQPPVKRARKSATTMESKLLIILDTLDENQIDMRQLLRTLARQRKDNRCRKYWLQFRRFAYQDMTRKYDNNSLPELDSSDWDKLLDAGGRHRIHHELRKELSRLANNKSVVTWESPSSDSLGFIEKLDSIKDIINAEAPALVKMLSLIARPSDSPASEPLTMGLRQAMWICMFLFSMQSHRCNGLAKTLTLYLMDSGVKKRVVDQLSSLNVCVSYTTGQTMIKKLRGFGAAEVRKRGVDLRNCTSYDNYDYVEHKSAERLGSRKEQKGITTALQYRGIGISEQGLRQSMWRPHHKIRVKDIVIDNNYIKLILKKSRRHFLHEALTATYPNSRSSEDQADYDKNMKMPTMQRVKYPKTISWPLEPIQQNESTTEGNIIIHEDIEERQLHHDSNEPLWSTVLKPYYGDLKTVRQILAVQSCRHNAERPYDTRRWIIPGLGLWHLRLNMLRLIHKIHWGGVRPKDSSTLQYAADHWRRSNVNTGADFAKLEALLIHSYQARVSALITRAAVKRRWMTGKSTKIITKWLNRCSAKCYVQVIDEVVDLVHSLASTAHEDPWIEDEVMENHLRFMRHMEVYLLLRHSIKYGDIGMLRQALRDACVMFQAPEGSTNLYAAELIRLIHLYCSDAADVELQEAMLINSLVNLQGRDGKCFEADRLLEYLNGILKEGLGARRNSTKSPEDLMAEIALTVPYMLQLRLKVHQFTHRYYRGNHPEKSVAEDLQIMALDIIERDMLMLNQERFSAYFAVDLLRSGAKSLGANVDKYNEKIRMGGDWDAAVPDLTSDLPERPGSPTTQLLNDIGEN